MKSLNANLKAAALCAAAMGAIARPAAAAELEFPCPAGPLAFTCVTVPEYGPKRPRPKPPAEDFRRLSANQIDAAALEGAHIVAGDSGLALRRGPLPAPVRVMMARHPTAFKGGHAYMAAADGGKIGADSEIVIFHLAETLAGQ